MLTTNNTSATSHYLFKILFNPRGQWFKYTLKLNLGNKIMFLTDINIQWNWPMLICPRWSSHLPKTQHVVVGSMGKFDWGVQYVIIFLCKQFWIWLGTVSYRGKEVRTVDSPAVRSVNKSRDTRNCAQNEPKYAICVLVATRLYYKALGIILCSLI